jgi:hypothetical protein
MKKMMKNRREQHELWELMISRAVASLASGVLVFTVGNLNKDSIDLTSFLNIISFILFSIAFFLLISSLFTSRFSGKSRYRFRNTLEPLWGPFILLSLAGIIKSSIDSSQRLILVVLAGVFLIIFVVSQGLYNWQMRPHFKPPERVQKLKYDLNLAGALGITSILLSIAQTIGNPAFGVNLLISLAELFCAWLLIRSLVVISKMFSRAKLWENFKFNLGHFKSFLIDS